MIDSRFTPQARIAAISLSALMREKTRTLATRSASGIVHCIVSGKLTSANWPMSEGETLTVFRRYGRRGIMPEAMALYFNRIDIGIFLCILEICLAEKGIPFSRELYPDPGDPAAEYAKAAEYRV